MPEVRVEFAFSDICFECQRCGSCCHHRRPEGFDDLIPLNRLKEFVILSNLIYLSDSDVQAVSKRIGNEPASFVDTLYPYDGKTVKVKGHGKKVVLDIPVMKSKDDTTCVFYDEGVCGIYDIRPKACMLFPFRVNEMETPNGDIVLRIEYNEKCPGIGKGERVDLNRLEKLVLSQFVDRSNTVYSQLQELIKAGKIARGAKTYRSYPK